MTKSQFPLVLLVLIVVPCVPDIFYFQLSNHLFEELAMDVYDEVDRRETDAGDLTWLYLISFCYQWAVKSCQAQCFTSPISAVLMVRVSTFAFACVGFRVCFPS